MVRAKMKSPHPARNAKTATVITAERASGMTMRRNVCHSDAPSTRAAYDQLVGQAEEERPQDEDRERDGVRPISDDEPGYEFTRWIQWKTMNRDVARTIDGTICATRSELTKITVTRRRYFDRA